MAATCGGVRVWSLYVPNGRALDSPHLATSWTGWPPLRAPGDRAGGRVGRSWCAATSTSRRDDDVWDPAAFVGSTHVSAAGARALRALLDLGLHDVKPRALKGAPFTYWDYRAGNFHKGMGMRIDLVLLGNGWPSASRDAYIDRDATQGQAPQPRPGGRRRRSERRPSLRSVVNAPR